MAVCAARAGTNGGVVIEAGESSAQVVVASAQDGVLRDPGPVLLGEASSEDIQFEGMQM